MADMEDWSLQAIVRGSSGDFTKSVDLDMDVGKDNNNNNNKLFDGSANYHQQFDREFLASFPEIFEALTGSGDELEELYKPFYPAAGAKSLPAQAVLNFQEQVKIGPEDKPARDQADLSSGSSSVATATAGYTPKYKRRKNQHKRVVIQVTADGLSSDLWAWRKYGQKPIKGSPYPRSYYRCSSSKGCLARKQVEQSCNDPGMFIITYTAEHSHSQPTRRNSLAGTVRQKFPPLKTPNSTTTHVIKQEKITGENSSCSPSSPKNQVSCDQLLFADHQATMIKEESKEDNDFKMSEEFVLNEDFFSGLEDFDDFISEMPICLAAAQQFPVRSCS